MSERTLTLARIRGRNGSASPLDLPDDIAVEASNIEFYRSSLGAKREGLAAVTHGGSFTSVLSALKKHVPANNLANAELWGVDAAATPNVGRMAAGTTFAAITMLDNIQTAPFDFRTASFNGKLFMAYDSSANRLHCWDGTIQRRVGLATPSAPTVANTGAGTYAATLRYYRVRDVILSGSTIIARSEPSASTSFTPSGTGTAARVTYVTTNSDAASTHWEVEASTDNVTFWRLARTAEATTTYDDSAAVATYPDNTASARAGAYEFPVSWRYLAAFHGMLVGMGAWESGQPQSRVWFTAPLGTTGEGDDERIINTTDQRNYESINEGSGGDSAGFGGPIFGNLLAFKRTEIWKLIPTNTASKPLRPFREADGVGAIRQEAIVNAIDEDSEDAVYFLDLIKGPMRIGKRGVEWIGEDVEDQWALYNPGATNVPCWGLYYALKHQVRFWIATGSANDPSLVLVFDTRLGAWSQDDKGVRHFTGGWSIWDTPAAGLPRARCGVVFSRTPGATMSLDERPYYGDSGANDVLWRGDNGQNSDAGTSFRSLLTSKDYPLAGGQKVETFDPVLVAEAESGVTITVSQVEDFGLNQSGGGTARSGTALLTASASGESRVIRKIEGLRSASAAFHRFTIGDAAAAANTWNLDRLIVPIGSAEPEVRGN